MWSKSKLEQEFQYGGRLGEFNGMSSQSHLPHCRVLPPAELNDMSSQSRVSLCRVGLLLLGEFTVTIPEPHATSQGAITWRNKCRDRAKLQGVRIPSAILNIVFRHISLFFVFFNAVWALTSGGFRIVSALEFVSHYFWHQINKSANL